MPYTLWQKKTEPKTDMADMRKNHARRGVSSLWNRKEGKMERTQTKMNRKQNDKYQTHGSINVM
jgi:hypothetical protein